jgi:wobble nucleotide-excising tRNase
MGENEERDAEFRGFIKATVEGLEKNIETKLNSYGDIVNLKFSNIEKQTAENHEQLCAVSNDVLEIKKNMAVASAVKKVRDSMWGAIGGTSAVLLVAVIKEVIKKIIKGE